MGQTSREPVIIFIDVCWKMKLPLLLCAILLISYADALVGHRYYCPPDFVRLGNGCYLFSSHITSWQNAHFACRDAQAQLAVFETRWEDSTIGTYLSRPEFAPLERWIGGLYDWNGQQWLWGATGEPMKYLGFGDLTSDRLRNGTVFTWTQNNLKNGTINYAPKSCIMFVNCLWLEWRIFRIPSSSENIAIQK